MRVVHPVGRHAVASDPCDFDQDTHSILTQGFVFAALFESLDSET